MYNLTKMDRKECISNSDQIYVFQYSQNITSEDVVLWEGIGLKEEHSDLRIRELGKELGSYGIWKKTDSIANFFVKIRF